MIKLNDDDDDVIVYRPVCEVVANDGRQAYKEEENINQEMHPQPLLQWVIFFWSPLWTDTGK